LRSGDTHTTNNIYGFIENTFDKLKGKKIGLVRADSGFYDKISSKKKGLNMGKRFCRYCRQN